MRKFLFGACSSVLLFSCGDFSNTPKGSQPKKEWNSNHDPHIMQQGHNYEYKFDKLPMKGELKKKPWSDDYWPDYKGGISYRWNDENSVEESRYKYHLLSKHDVSKTDLRILSPAEKFDIYLGRFDFPKTKEERTRTEVLTNYNIPEWEGLCDGWAPATLFFDEPGPVVMKGKTGIDVPFGSSDVKALLVHFVKEVEAPTQFLGTRCEVDMNKLRIKLNRGLITHREYQEELELCSGLNAGTFHVILTNQIALKHEGFIVNIDIGPEIWNQAVFKFGSKIISDRKGHSSEAAPGTVREVEIETQMYYVDESPQNWERNQEMSQDVELYQYRIELNAKDIIIGGTWISEKRPGFAWKQDKPRFQGKTFEAIRDIYEASLKNNAVANVSSQPRTRLVHRSFFDRFRRR